MTMNDPVALAAMNNVLQSEAVLAAVGSTGQFTASFWSNNHAYDIPYANGATLGSRAYADEHDAAIEKLHATRQPGAATYIMDSFAALDLAPKGFRVRIADEWFIREKPVESSHPAGSFDIRQIRSADELAKFEAASVVGFDGVPPETPGHTYPASLLSDHRFRFFALWSDENLAAGILLFMDPACTGVFTIFTLPAHRGKGLGTALLQHTLDQAPALPLATNPSAMSRGIFQRLGFVAVGERRIWVSEPTVGNLSPA